MRNNSGNLNPRLDFVYLGSYIFILLFTWTIEQKVTPLFDDETLDTMFQKKNIYIIPCFRIDIKRV